MRKIKSLQELQKIELEMMKHIHEFCIQNDIKYFLAYGTLIGAVRHKGFIPWDDDIDIWMLRKDYEMFCKSFDEFGIKHHLKLVNAGTSPRYNRAMAKVINQDTVLKEELFCDEIELGVFIDIFPLDSVPDNNVLKVIHRIRIDFWNKVLFSIVKLQNNMPWYKRVIHFCAKRLLSPEKVANHLNELVVKYNNSKRVCTYQDIAKAIYDISLFNDTVLCDFDDYKFYIPLEYDPILRATYNDYMKLPPENTRVGRHPSSVYWK